MECGIDNSPEVVVGSDVPLNMYPWVGILYYVSHDMTGEVRAVTTVILIQQEFVIGAAADIGPMPKYDFRENTRVILGDGWRGNPLRVRSYVIHPEYGETLNTVALVQLKDIVRPTQIKPVCPPPDLLRDPEFYVIKFHENYNDLKKQVIPVEHVPSKMCRDFYVSANLGVGVRGPGCGAPARFLDMLSYYPWVEASLNKFRQLTITRLSNQKFVLRSGGGRRNDGEDEEIEHHVMRYGACDEEEKTNLIYRDQLFLRTDNQQYQFITYNMTIYENVEYSCLTLELVNASAVSEMRVKHFCPRESRGPICYSYKGSLFEISVYIIYSDACMFEMVAWGWKKNMTLIDVQEWKWEEGTYYQDFSMTRVEYRGPADTTGYGFEPLDDKMWIPEYDFWTTTPFDNSSWLSTTERRRQDGTEPEAQKGGSMTRGPLPPPGTSDTDSEFEIGVRW
ncbi:unnamed protein product [Chilo suppressalis]|uniref:Peptidase S1 domain-containing protein n=1 Tax=Chilo suppressalis TaxID=168631 RepID=A0ABN8L8E7_CHISP|nr:unnamed protein product [Chilo suppressalis]